MRINTLLDIVGRLLVMSWTWVFILDFVVEFEFNIVSRVFILIFTIWWSVIPYLEEKRKKEKNK